MNVDNFVIQQDFTVATKSRIILPYWFGWAIPIIAVSYKIINRLAQEIGIGNWRLIFGFCCFFPICSHMKIGVWMSNSNCRSFIPQFSYKITNRLVQWDRDWQLETDIWFLLYCVGQREHTLRLYLLVTMEATLS